MKTIIYYSSKCGHTKNYAESLSNRIVCDYLDYKKMKVKKMMEYDTIIFMSSLMNNKIRHVEKFLKLYKKIKDKNLIIVAVGMQPSTPDRRQSIITINLLDDYHIRLYELVGGFDANKLSWPLRKIMSLGLKAAAKKEPLIKQNMSQATSILTHPIEYNDINGIERIMETIHKLERESKIV